MHSKRQLNSPSPQNRGRNTRGARPHFAYKARQGQAAILIALAILALLAVVGLAIDGGAAYAQRRAAQNSADAAALSATRVMLDRYMDMVAQNPDGDIDGSYQDDQDIRQTITDYATRHGVDPSALQAYYVTDSKQAIG